MSRLGGLSEGAWASFNLAYWVGDDPSAVAANWERWRVAYPAMRVAQVKQVHGNIVRTIDSGYDGARLQADGMVTAAAGIALGIFTADCVPILIVDPVRRSPGLYTPGGAEYWAISSPRAFAR